MSGGGSQVTAATPWAPAQPYLSDIMNQAKGLYGQMAPFYSNPAANFNYGQTTGAVGNIIGGTSPFGSMASSLSPGTTQAIQQQLSGTPDYTAVKGALDAANQQTWDSFNNQFVPQLNQRASFLGNPSGAIKDLNWAASQIGNNMNLNAQQQYLGQYDFAKQQQANAAGLGANIAQGAGSQALQGANLFGSLSQLPQSNLADYANIISGTGGKFGTSTETNKPGGATTATNIIGGLTAGAGLLNTLTGATPASGGTIGTIGSLFGGSSLPSLAGAAADATGSIASTAGAGMASTAGNVAASNSAWLGGSGLGSGAAADAGALGADAAGSTAAGGAGGAAGAEGATGSSGLGSSLAAAAPYAAAALAIGAPIYGAFSKPVTLDASWWKGLEQGVQSGNTTARMTLANLMVNGDPQAVAMGQKYGVTALTPYLQHTPYTDLPVMSGGMGGNRYAQKA